MKNIILIHSILLILLPLYLYSAPAPIPKNSISEEDKLIGTWNVLDCGYSEKWTFYKNGNWRSDSTYNGGCITDGTWDIRHRNYLYISYRNTQCIHKLGTKVHTRYDTRDGSVWSNLKLIFVKKVK